MSLHAPDLSVELWRHAVNGWSELVREGHSALNGPVGGQLTRYDIKDGTVLSRLPYGGVAKVVAVGKNVYLIEKSGKEFFEAVDRAGRVVWHLSAFGHVTSTESRFLITNNLDSVLLCVDACTGRVVWTFEAPREGVGEVRKRSNRMVSGFPSVATIGDRVVVTLFDFRVFVLSLETGGVIGAARPSFGGPYLVTETSIFFAQAFGLSEFDHREMREVDRIEYRTEVEPLYAGNRPTVNAFWLSEESIVWTTMHGVLMGVSRRPGPDGRRVTWSYEVPGTIMPIAEPPIGFGEYLYYTRRGDNRGLLCFRSADFQG